LYPYEIEVVKTWETVTPYLHTVGMGALPYDERHDNEKVLVDCDICNKRFLLYSDKAPTCSGCLTDKTVRQNRSKQGTPIAFLFDS
jgi:hypothetical protein